ncbi:MAG: dynamin family protein [Bacteroidota bacterium]|nr:dynamin family protein [Bacteroidota bacterium]
MAYSLLELDLSPQKARLDEMVKNLHDLSHQIQHASWPEMISELRNRIHEPFMFVIVGEVKVGKSSFINALLESKTEICKVAPSPMTDTIQQIVYGPEYTETAVSPVLKRITYPEEILKEIAIVDTPGTNTIISHHQEITEKFIPSSDLVVFVFEAKNPYRQSAWDLFDFIKSEWHKKIIFILQQKDLIDPPDLEINIKGLERFAKEKGMDQVLIFPVSAKLELEHKEIESGFIPLRDYIREHITGGKAVVYKLLNNLNTFIQITDKLKLGIDIRQQQYQYDLEFRQDIKNTLDEHERISMKHIELLVENLVANYNRSTQKKREELHNGLGFFSVLKRGLSGIFSKEQSLQTWLKSFTSSFEQDLNGSLKEKLYDGAKDLSDSIQQMGQIVSLKIQTSKTILKNDHEIFSDIADRRAKVLEELQGAFTMFLQNTDTYYKKDLLSKQSNLAPNVATGTGIAIVGAMITALTHGIVFDITGGILTTIGVFFAGITLGLQKRKIMNQYDSEIIQGRTKLEHEIRSRLVTYLNHIITKLNENFVKLDRHLIIEKEQIDIIQAKHTDISGNLHQLKNEVEELTQLKYS